jgi:O-antigen/teichoic acid export membrane protein
MTSRVARNSVFLLAAQFVDRASSYLFVLYLTRTMGAEVFGNYLTVTALVAMAGGLVDFGLYNLIVRDMARERSAVSAYLARVVPLRLALAGVAYLLLLGAAWLMAYPAEILALVGIAGLVMVLGVPGTLLSSGLDALEHMHRSALCGMLGRVLTIALGIAALVLGQGLRGVFLGSVVATGITWVTLLVVGSGSGVRMGWIFDRSFLVSLARRSLPYAVIAVGLIYLNLDFVLLSRFYGAQEVGLYGAARKPLEYLAFIPGSVTGALLPAMAAEFSLSGERFWRGYSAAVYLLICLALPLAVIAILLRERLIVALFGQAFLPAAAAVPALALSLVIVFLLFPTSLVAFSAGLVREFLPTFTFNALAGIALQWLIIPRYGYVGASLSFLASSLIGCMTLLRFQRRFFGQLPPLGRMGVRPLIASGIMAAAIWMGSALPLAPLILLAGGVYAGGLHLAGGYHARAWWVPRPRRETATPQGGLNSHPDT